MRHKRKPSDYMEPCTEEELMLYIRRCREGLKREGKQDGWLFAFWLKDFERRLRNLRKSELVGAVQEG